MAMVGLFTLLASLLSYGSGSSQVDVVVYYESLCPDSENFVKNQLVPTYPEMKQYMTVELVPYGNAHSFGDPGRYTFTCQHGPEECYGNMVQACYISLVTDTASQIKFVNCAFNAPSQQKVIYRCVSSTDLLRQLINCVNGTQGPNLLYENGNKTPPHSFIPWITINGEGSRDITDGAIDDLKKTVCNAIEGEKPDICIKSNLNMLKKFRNNYL